jgi:hypothetical protein
MTAGQTQRHLLELNGVLSMSGSWLQCGLTILVVTMANGRLRAVAPQISDDGHFFSAEAIKRGNAQIHDLMKNFGRDLLIETFATAPKDQLDKLKAMAAEERRKYFHGWATDRAQSAVVNGIYIMVCKDPPHVQVEITPKASAVFDKATRDQLVQELLKNFQAKRFDEGLDAAVRIVKDRLTSVGGKPE